MIDLVDTTGASGTSITLADTNAGQGTAFALKSGSGAGGSGSTGQGRHGPRGRPRSLRHARWNAFARPNRFGHRQRRGRQPGRHQRLRRDEIPGIVDPMAQTAITPSAGEINLESVGSGSGLLDLSRERDDTSLGAVLEEITPGASGTAMPASDTGIGGGVDLEEPRGGIDRVPLAPTYVTAYDPMAPAFGWAALGAALVALFGIYALISGVMDTWPSILQGIDSKHGSQAWFALGGGRGRDRYLLRHRISFRQSRVHPRSLGAWYSNLNRQRPEEFLGPFSHRLVRRTRMRRMPTSGSHRVHAIYSNLTSVAHRSKRSMPQSGPER